MMVLFLISLFVALLLIVDGDVGTNHKCTTMISDTGDLDLEAIGDTYSDSLWSRLKGFRYKSTIVSGSVSGRARRKHLWLKLKSAPGVLGHFVISFPRKMISSFPLISGSGGEDITELTTYSSTFMSKGKNMNKGEYFTSKMTGINDHLEQDVKYLGLSDEKRALISDIFKAPELHTIEAQQMSKSTHYSLSEHMIYRYLQSGNWAGNLFYGVTIPQAMVNTVTWRQEFGLHSKGIVDLEHLRPSLEDNLVYTYGHDVNNRPLLYFKVANNFRQISDAHFLELLMISVERADRESEKLGSGEFAAIIDLQGLTWTSCPSTSVIKTAIGLMKKHYPYRLHMLWVVNTGIVFQSVWRILKPVIPIRALKKIRIVLPQEMPELIDTIGVNYLEESYGGNVKAKTIIYEKYMADYYWKKVNGSNT